MNILVVEDDAAMASLLVHGLREEAHHVDVALDGKAALRVTGDTSFDLILLDVMLPGMDGLEIARQLRLRSKNALYEHALFRLCHTGDKNREETTHRRGTVDPFAGGNKFDFKGIEFVNDFQKVLRTPRQSVKCSDENNVEASSTRIRHESVKPRTSCFATRNASV